MQISSTGKVWISRSTLATSVPHSDWRLRAHRQSSVKSICPGLAELHARGDQNALRVDASLTLELKEQAHRVPFVRAAAELPAAAAKDGGGEELHQPAWLLDGNGTDC